MIRESQPSDIPQITKLGHQMYMQSIYSKWPWDWEKAHNMASRYTRDGDKLLLCFYKGDMLAGFLFANLCTHFYGSTKQATQQLFYIHPLHRGGTAAVRMMKKFEHWGRYNDCDNLCFSQSSEGADDRWHKFCQNLGYVHVGATFFKEL